MLSMLFLVYVTTPPIIYMVDNTIDITEFYSTSEEEEKGNEKNKDIEVICSSSENNRDNIDTSEVSNNSGYYLSKYPKPHLNIISPPPESHLIF